MNTRKIAVILNAGSGAHKEGLLLQEIKDGFARFEIEPQISLIHLPSQLSEKVLAAKESGFDTIVAAGGDGTISLVAGNLIGSDIHLGILPVGTLNHFAKDLDIPLTMPEACMVIAADSVREVDIGTVNDKVFINNSSVGLYQKLVRHREHLQNQGYSKWMAFVSALFKVLRLYPFLSVRLQSPEKTITAKTPIVFIGNNEYKLGGTRIGTRETIDQGFLTVHVAHKPTRWGLVRIAAHALFGNLDDSPDFDAYKTPELWIDSRKKYLNVSLDGEVTAMATPLHYQIKPLALKVITPKI